MIPKKIFFYWDKPYLSWMRYMTLYSFRKFNPNWEITLCLSTNKDWENDNTHQRDFTSYNGPNYFDKLCDLHITIEDAVFQDEFKPKIITSTPIHESDLYRYYRLYNNGGFYSDMDILYFRSMDDFYNNIIEDRSDTIVYCCDKYAAIGFLGAEKGNLFYKNLLEFVTTLNHTSSWELYGVILFYKFFNIDNTPGSLVKQINTRYKEQLKAFSIPKYLVYHYDAFEIQSVYDTAFGLSSFDTKSIGYHWYGGHPTSQKYNNILTSTNYVEHNITFSKLVSEIMEI